MFDKNENKQKEAGVGPFLKNTLCKFDVKSVRNTLLNWIQQVIFKAFLKVVTSKSTSNWIYLEEKWFVFSKLPLTKKNMVLYKGVVFLLTFKQRVLNLFAKCAIHTIKFLAWLIPLMVVRLYVRGLHTVAQVKVNEHNKATWLVVGIYEMFLLR